MLHEKARGVESAHSASKFLYKCLVQGTLNVAKLKSILVRNWLRLWHSNGERVNGPLHVHQRLVVKLGDMHGET